MNLEVEAYPGELRVLREAIAHLADEKWPECVPIENDEGEINDRELVEYLVDYAQNALKKR